jgi:hypothetical protein
MDTDIYSDDSYDYTNSPKLSPTDWYDQMAPNVVYQSKASTEYDNLTNHCLASQLTTNLLKLSMGWDNYKTDADHEPAAPVMLTTTPSPIKQHEPILPRQYNANPPLSPLTWNAQITLW